MLKLAARLLFGEHGLAPRCECAPLAASPDADLASDVPAAATLDRDIRALVEQAGFAIEHLDAGYLPGPRPMTFMYEGSARPR